MRLWEALVCLYDAFVMGRKPILDPRLPSEPSLDVEPDHPPHRQMVLRSVKAAQEVGRTCGELEAELGLSRGTTSSILSYFVRKRQFLKLGERYNPRTGNKQKVYVHRDFVKEKI